MIPDLTRRLYLATVYGTPAPQGSKSVDRRGIMYEQNRRSRPWRREMVETMLATSPPVPYDEPVEVRATFVLPRPKRPRFKVPGVKPDTDKLQRNLGDALEAAGVLRDDSRIVEWHVRKVYADEQHSPRVTVEVLRHDPLQWAGLGPDRPELTLYRRLSELLVAIDSGMYAADKLLLAVENLLDDYDEATL